MSDTSYSDSGSIPDNAGAGSAPAGSPASTSPSPGTSTPDSGGTAAPESMDFEAMFSGPSEAPPDLGLQPSVTPTAKPAAPPAAPSAPPQAPPQVAQAPAQAQAPQPQGIPQPPPQAAQQPAGGGIPEGLDRYDPAQLAAALAANEAQLTEVLATQVMALSPAEVEALETNVVEAIPRLMAKTLLQAQKSALNQMAALMPVAVQRHLETMQRAGGDEGNFWRAWPQLNPAQHRQLVWNYTSMFRRAYPQATLQDIIAHVGPMVMGAVGVQRQPQAQGQQQRPMQQRGVASNGRSPPPSPFVPAGSMGPVPGATRSELTPWEAMFVERE